MDKVTLLNTLHTNRELFENVVSQVSEPLMIEPIGKDQQCGKDIIAHLTAWEQRVLRWLRTATSGETPQSPEPGKTWDDMDQLNAESLAQNKDRSLQEVFAVSQHSFQELLQQIEVFSDEELNIARSFAWVWQGDSPEQGKPLWKSILGGPCYAHYQDHMYDFLVRTDPSHRFVPDPTIMQRYAGSYLNEQIGTLAFRVADNTLLLCIPWQEQEIPALALDNRRFAYEDFGLITFNTAEDNTALSLEWWTRTFLRTS